MQEHGTASPPRLQKLRQLVALNIDKQSPTAAVFFANKLTTLSDSPEDLLLLAKVSLSGLQDQRPWPRTCTWLKPHFSAWAWQ